MEKEVIVDAFIKAVDAQYFDAFLERGEVYMNPISFFSNYENESKAVGDKYEGASIAVGLKVTISVAPIGTDNEFKVFTNNAKDFLIHDHKYDGNILSLYTVSVKNNEHILSAEFLQEFKNCRFCLISAPNLFLKKLNREILKKGYKPTTKLVSYFEPDEKEIYLNPFLKRDIYSYQLESRVFFHNSFSKPELFKIGSMQKFAFEIFPDKYIYMISNDKNNIIIRR